MPPTSPTTFSNHKTNKKKENDKVEAKVCTFRDFRERISRTLSSHLPPCETYTRDYLGNPPQRTLICPPQPRCAKISALCFSLSSLSRVFLFLFFLSFFFCFVFVGVFKQCCGVFLRDFFAYRDSNSVVYPLREIYRAGE